MSLRSKLAQSIYDFLDVGKSPRPADCIFVLPGSEDQKTYGTRMSRFGYASQLILSDGEAAGLRSAAKALSKRLQENVVRSCLVVASPMQLRRADRVFRRIFRKRGIQLTFVAVPENPSFDSPAVRAQIWSEFGKYLCNLCNLWF